MGEDETFATADFLINAPVVGSPTITQIQSITADNVTAGTPVIPNIAVTKNTLIPIADLDTGSPDVGSFAIGQQQSFTASDVVAGNPVVPNIPYDPSIPRVVNYLVSSRSVVSIPTNISKNSVTIS
jgi:hypothetical protein